MSNAEKITNKNTNRSTELMNKGRHAVEGVRQKHNKDVELVHTINSMFDEALTLCESVDIEDEGRVTLEDIVRIQDQLKKTAKSIGEEYPDNVYAQEKWEELQQLIFAINKERRKRGDDVDYSAVG